MRHYIPWLLLALPLAGCPHEQDDDDSADIIGDDDTGDDDTGDDDTGDDDVPDTYAFDGRFGGGSSVAYDGQVFRHALIVAMKSHLGGLTARLDGGFFPAAGDVVDELNFYFEFDDATSAALPHGIGSTPSPSQLTWGDLSSGKDLVGKLAGNDPVGQHQDWGLAFEGWPQPGVTTPETLMRFWFDRVDEQARDWSLGNYPLDPDGAPVGSVLVTSEGQDLGELIQKFLLGAVAFSQGADDYLDDDEPGKGLLSDNTVAEDGKPYTALEHAWDEGWGYFGGAVRYGLWDDATIAGAGYADDDADGAIDLLTERAWGHALNAGKRDAGAAAIAATDLTGEAWDAFRGGRALIARGPLDAAGLDALRVYRDDALRAWEGAIAATVVHYINDVLADMATFGTEAYDFEGHAKHWSECKGFALSLQFSRFSPLDGAGFSALHEALGTAPVLPGADAEDIDFYADALRTARGQLITAYAFDPALAGDDDGAGGW